MTRLDYQPVRDEYLNVTCEHIEMTTGSTKSHLAVMMDMLGLAAVNATYLHTACESVEDAPTSAAVLYQLRQGWLTDVSLKRADLRRADLQGTRLQRADLQGARLQRANLQGVRLILANLQEVNLLDVVFDEDTTLPDGTQWTPEADLARFTDPAHLNFWRSDDPDSPAYRDDGEETPEA